MSGDKKYFEDFSQTWPEDNIVGKLTDERFRKLSLDYENEQRNLNGQVALLREEIETAESKSADVNRFLSIVKQYTETPELTPFILHEFVEKIVITMRPILTTRPTADKKWISTTRVSEFWKCQKYLMIGRNERNGIAVAIPFLSRLTMFS